MVLSLYCTVHGSTDFFLFFVFYFFSHCIFVFVLLYFVFRYCIRNIVTIVSYHGRPARLITPFWQPAYPLHSFTLLRQINSAAAAEKQSHSGHILRRPTQMNAAYFMGRQVLNSIWLSLKLHCTDTRQPATTTTVAQQMSTQAVVCRY